MIRTDHTPDEAKSLVKAWLKELGLPDHKLSAKTAGFDGDSRVVVTVKDWMPDPRAAHIKVRANVHKFIVLFSGEGIDDGIGAIPVEERRQIRRDYINNLEAL